MTHLTTGAVTLADAPTDGSPPILSDALAGLFLADGFGGRGAVGAAGRSPGMADNQIYITSRTEARVQMVNVVRPSSDGLPRLAPSDFFFLNAVGPSRDARGIVFGQGGDRAYIANRFPPLLHVIDTSAGPDGRPINRFVAGVEICAEASNLTRVDTARGERVYVACFRSGQVWVVDPTGAVVEAIIDVGRGPNTILAVPSLNRLYVSNFLEDTLAVIDTTPGSSTENRVVLRVGRTRQSESN
jgi:YVTN family beta-propeller protein